MNLSSFKQYCLTKKGAEETYPFGKNAVWFKIGGKAFCWTFVEPFNMDGQEREPFHFVNAKCEPGQAEAWREQFPAVQPGWHQSKKHWNSIYQDGSLQDADFKMIIDHAYEVVLSSLPKKTQEKIRS